MRIPETLLATFEDSKAFLYSDSNGILRILEGKQYLICSVTDVFLSTSSSQQVTFSPYLRPGIRFPRYLVFNEGARLKAVWKRKEVKGKLKAGFDRVQRYVVSQDVAVRTFILRYRPHREPKLYLIRPTGGSSPPSPFIASLATPQSISITREKRMKEDCKCMLKTTVSLLNEYLLGGNEGLEDVWVSCLRGYDGLLYLLNCSRVRLKERGPARAVSLPRLFNTTRIEDSFSPLSQRKDPNPSETTAFQALSRPGIGAPLRPRPTDTLPLHHHNDTLGRSMPVLPTTQKSDFQGKIMRKMFEKVCNDEVLARFFPRNSRTAVHLMRTVDVALNSEKEVRGVREAHGKLNVTEEDFDRYVRHLLATLHTHGASPSTLDLALTRLNAFRPAVLPPPIPR